MSILADMVCVKQVSGNGIGIFICPYENPDVKISLNNGKLAGANQIRTMGFLNPRRESQRRRRPLALFSFITALLSN